MQAQTTEKQPRKRQPTSMTINEIVAQASKLTNAELKELQKQIGDLIEERRVQAQKQLEELK
jgi:hypothetical protein